MDMYDYSFFLSTMWVGPFWFAMLVFPEHEMTKKVMQGPWFFLGPILIWWAATIASPQGLIDFAKDSADPTGILESLAALMGTKGRCLGSMGPHGRRRYFRNPLDVEALS